MNPAEAREIDSSRYPPHLTEAGFMEPCPRRIRALRGGVTVLDTLRAFYVWEVPYYPAYYVPVEDVDPALVDPADHPDLRERALRRARPRHLGLGRRLVRGGRRGLRRPSRGAPTRGSTRSAPRAASGSRSTASSSPSRAPRCCSSRPACRPATTSRAPTSTSPSSSAPRPPPTALTRGRPATTGRRGSATPLHEDIAWSYAYPAPQVLQIAGLVAFYDEKVDTFLDGVPVSRPQTKFSGEESR